MRMYLCYMFVILVVFFVCVPTLLEVLWWTLWSRSYLLFYKVMLFAYRNFVHGAISWERISCDVSVLHISYEYLLSEYIFLMHIITC
jgi:hypothetical protein